MRTKRSVASFSRFFVFLFISNLNKVFSGEISENLNMRSIKYKLWELSAKSTSKEVKKVLR